MPADYREPDAEDDDETSAGSFSPDSYITFGTLCRLRTSHFCKCRFYGTASPGFSIDASGSCFPVSLLPAGELINQ